MSQMVFPRMKWLSCHGSGHPSRVTTTPMVVRHKGYVGQDKFMKWVEEDGGKIQRQTGGSVHMQSTASSSAMARQSENNFIDKMSQSMSPVVIPVPTGGGSQPQVASSGSPTPPVPSLPANPNNTAALDLAYRLSMGASFA